MLCGSTGNTQLLKSPFDALDFGAKLPSSMSARKTEVPLSLTGAASCPTECLSLPADAVHIRKNGIEFRSHRPISPWTEMTVSLERPGDTQKVRCTGVIVVCGGNRTEGYQISMLFTNLSRQSQVALLGYL